ncbi:hypothetical protein GCM10010302_26680 [Streptomyces polychromogenes]|uniref:Uncharacterized protein n=1 Tax=Streptomyces polychromogenes TaxID=67342 RepID=A0ABP3EZI9_9ACTN
MTDTRPLRPDHRDAVREAVQALLGEARDILFHESADGAWAYEEEDGQALLDAANQVRLRLDTAVGNLRRTLATAQASHRGRRRS